MAVRGEQPPTNAPEPNSPALHPPISRCICIHPDDVDTSALARQWRDALFGADDVLVDHSR